MASLMPDNLRKRLSLAARKGIGAFAVLTMAFFSSCNIINPPEEVPAYITFENPGVVLDTNTGFVSSAGIRDVWFYSAGVLQGTYAVNPVPDGFWTTVPYLIDENTSFFMEGGIHESGQSAFHLPYPFWERVEFSIAQEPGDTFTVRPLFYYKNDTEIEVEVDENFETSVFSLVPFSNALTQPDSTSFRRRSNGAFQGNYSGFVPFGQDDRWFEVINADPFLAQRDQDIYAEITYRNNVDLRVGLIYQDILGALYSEPIITLTPSTEWNTTYVHLIGQIRTIINNFGEATNFWLWLSADGEGNDGYIWLDNVRVIHED